MEVGNRSFIKKINKSLILEKIIEYKSISRADLARVIGLNKATVSSQVNELLDKKLLYETHSDYNSDGRRPVLLSINDSSRFILGIDFEYLKTMIVISNLSGNIVEQKNFYLNTEDYGKIISWLANQINNYVAKYSYSTYGLISCIIGVHGTVNKDEQIQLITKFQWHNVSFKKDIENLITIPVTVENNANLSALAEKVFYYNSTSPLLSISLSSGVGSGRIVNWEIDKGYQGFAGEMGHMIIYPDGPKCFCGQRGCWELFATEVSFFNQLSNLLCEPILTIDDFKKISKSDNPVIQEAMQKYIYYISIGLNNVINLYNPGIIVINSKVLALYPNAIEQITSHFSFNAHSYKKIVLSGLEEKACALGGCALGIMNFFDITKLSLENMN